MRLPRPVFQELPGCPPILRMSLTRLLMVTRRFCRTLTQKQKIQMKETAMKSPIPKTELQPSTQLLNYKLLAIALLMLAVTVPQTRAQSIYATPYTFANLAGLPGGATGFVDGTGTSARFSNVHGVAVDSAGNVWLADYNNYTIRKITPAGVVTTVAGQVAVAGHADGYGTNATFYYPVATAVDSAGTLYIGDDVNYTVRKIDTATNVTTLAGLARNAGTANGTGSAARFWYPRASAVDSAGNVYVADVSNNMIRKITPA